MLTSSRLLSRTEQSAGDIEAVLNEIRLCTDNPIYLFGFQASDMPRREIFAISIHLPFNGLSTVLFEGEAF